METIISRFQLPVVPQAKKQHDEIYNDIVVNPNIFDEIYFIIVVIYAEKSFTGLDLTVFLVCGQSK